MPRTGMPSKGSAAARSERRSSSGVEPYRRDCRRRCPGAAGRRSLPGVSARTASQPTGRGIKQTVGMLAASGTSAPAAATAVAPDARTVEQHRLDADQRCPLPVTWPCSIAWWPTVTFSPTVTGNPGQHASRRLLCTLLRRPVRIVSLSARSTAQNQFHRCPRRNLTTADDGLAIGRRIARRHSRHVVAESV